MHTCVHVYVVHWETYVIGSEKRGLMALTFDSELSLQT